MERALNAEARADLEHNYLDRGVEGDDKLISRERASRRIQLILEGLARKRGFGGGQVKVFGSFSNGFKTGTSDLDVAIVLPLPYSSGETVLRRYEKRLTEHVGNGKLGFENVTKIFKATVPLLKFTDLRSGMEVDLCVNNELGVRNSQLLQTYCKFDARVLQLGRAVKDWAKRHELVGTADGCLNSYAYMLLVVHFLLTLPQPVCPNLQKEAKRLGLPPVLVRDTKWGCEDDWDTSFCSEEHFDRLEHQPRNEDSVADLLVQFFYTYAVSFDWQQSAVCIRLAGPGAAIEKSSAILKAAVTKDQWYIEDPFDLRHNLAGKCSVKGRERILEVMRESYQLLQRAGGWKLVFPPQPADSFFLKCRISASVTPEILLEKFEGYGLRKLYIAKPESNEGRVSGQAFFEFGSPGDRRRAHACNEDWLAEDCQLFLHYSTQHSLKEALEQSHFSTFNMDSYKMQKAIIQQRGLTHAAMMAQRPQGSEQLPPQFQEAPPPWMRGPMAPMYPPDVWPGMHAGKGGWPAPPPPPPPPPGGPQAHQHPPQAAMMHPVGVPTMRPPGMEPMLRGVPWALPTQWGGKGGVAAFPAAPAPASLASADAAKATPPPPGLVEAQSDGLAAREVEANPQEPPSTCTATLQVVFRANAEEYKVLTAAVAQLQQALSKLALAKAVEAPNHIEKSGALSIQLKNIEPACLNHPDFDSIPRLAAAFRGRY